MTTVHCIEHENIVFLMCCGTQPRLTSRPNFGQTPAAPNQQQHPTPQHQQNQHNPANNNTATAPAQPPQFKHPNKQPLHFTTTRQPIATRCHHHMPDENTEQTHNNIRQITATKTTDNPLRTNAHQCTNVMWGRILNFQCTCTTHGFPRRTNSTQQPKAYQCHPVP